MEKILKALDRQQFADAAKLCDLQIKAAKSEQYRVIWQAIKAYCYCFLGQFAYARQIIDPLNFAELLESDPVSKRTITMCNYSYAITLTPELLFLNFDLNKIDPIDKYFQALKSSEKNPRMNARESLTISVCQHFMRLCRHKVVSLDTVCNNLDAFLELFDIQALKDDNNSQVIGERLHRENAFSIINNTMMYLSALNCTSLKEQDIEAVLSKYMENQIVSKALFDINPRLHLLLSTMGCKDRLQQQLLENYIHSADKSYVSPILSLLVEEPQELEAKDTFMSQYIVYAYRLEHNNVEPCNLLRYVQTIEDLQLLFDLSRRYQFEMTPNNALSDYLFAEISEDRLVEVLTNIQPSEEPFDSLIISGIILRNKSKYFGVYKDYQKEIETLVAVLEKDYYHNAFYLKALLDSINNRNSSYLLTEYSQRIESAHNLYLTSMPYTFSTFFAEEFEPAKLSANDVFQSIFSINHTKKEQQWRFPQIVIGGCLHVAQNKYEAAKNAFDSLVNACNPFTAGRLLEAKHLTVLSYQRLFYDSLLSAYNIAFAGPRQLKEKTNLLFEGVCGSEMGSAQSAGQYIFSGNSDVSCSSSLFFHADDFCDQNIAQPAGFEQAEAKSQPKAIQQYSLFQYEGDFGKAFKALFVPELRPKYTRFDLLAQFTAAVMRLLFSVLNGRAPQLEQYILQFRDIEVPFFDARAKEAFVFGLLYERMALRGGAASDAGDAGTCACTCTSPLQTNADIYVAGVISQAILRVAELRKVKVDQERELAKQLFGKIFE